MRQLSTLALGGILSVMLLAGDAEACHKKKCGCAPVVCAPAPVVYVAPAPCVKPVKTCMPKVKKCGGGGLLAALCHKKPKCAPAPCMTVAYNYAPTYSTAPMASGQSYPTPQTTMPPVPSKK